MSSSDLKLLGLPVGPKRTVVDLAWLLFRGAASVHQRSIQRKIDHGLLGSPLNERLPLLTAIHREWQDAITSCISAPSTIMGLWGRLKAFVAYADSASTQLTLETSLDTYLRYCHWIQGRDDLKPTSKYSYSLAVATVIGPAIGMDAAKLQWKSRVVCAKPPVYTTAKENLQDTTSFIQLLLYVTEQVSLNVVRGPLPVTLKFDHYGSYVVHCGPEHAPISSLKQSSDKSKFARAASLRERRAKDVSNKARSALINLRLEAELLIFINQTACNLTQALQLRGVNFRFRTDGDYLQLIVWKSRAKHYVGLRIHKAYRSHFEIYLRWRKALFCDDDDDLTFPFVWEDGTNRTTRTLWGFPYCRRLTASLGLPFVHARQLRKTVANFVRRTASRQAAAELLGNSVTTFRRAYEEVDHQRSLTELVSFWNETEAFASAVGPGACQQPVPQREASPPTGSPFPDCSSPGGCLFCDKNRDIKSFDHVWNLTSMRHLKLAEINADRTPRRDGAEHMAERVAERITAKLEAFSRLGSPFSSWVDEAIARVQEGHYHPFYVATFTILEGS